MSVSMVCVFDPIMQRAALQAGPTWALSAIVEDLQAKVCEAGGILSDRAEWSATPLNEKLDREIRERFLAGDLISGY